MYNSAVPHQRAMTPEVAAPTPGLVYGPGSPLAAIRSTCIRIAASNATVLLTGETGTGKEVFARLVHAQSARADRPFVPVNCGAIPETLIESELFGYVRGAFTGAVAARRGRVSMAEGGTLFLDEIGELSLGMQVKLLRLLQERTYEPVGSSTSTVANFRLVVATNRDLAELVRLGRFRSDLFYRLHVCPVHLPPLRERPSDVVTLFQHFWKRHGEERPVTSAVLRRLERYDWPGNVRELENLVERLSVCAQGRFIEMADLPNAFLDQQEQVMLASVDQSQPVSSQVSCEIWDESSGIPEAISAPERSELLDPPVRRGPLAAAPLPADCSDEIPVSNTPSLLPTTLRLPVDLPSLLRSLEESYIRLALDQTGGNKKEAARLLGLGRTTLVEKLRRRATDASAP
jgi:sigma-54 dependent transcriptional regulator, flagellar regulatory protein